MRINIEKYYPQYTKLSNCGPHFGSICTARPIALLFRDLFWGTSAGHPWSDIVDWLEDSSCTFDPNFKDSEATNGTNHTCPYFLCFYRLRSHVQSNGLMHNTVRSTKSQRRIRIPRLIAKLSQSSRRACLWFCEPPLSFGTWERRRFCL